MELLKLDDDELQDIYRDVLKYDFDFENLAFEGGGAKLAGYFGVVKVSGSRSATDPDDPDPDDVIFASDS